MRCKTGQAQRVWEVEGTHPAPSKPKLRKGLWSPVEDNQLTNYLLREGLVGCWNYVAKQAGLQRTGKSCRLRWINYLRPGLKRHPISRQEEHLIIELQSILGNRWSQIAAQLPGRTDNEIKNYWNSCIRKKLWLKPYSSSSTAITNGNINSKFNHPFRSDRIGNANSMPADVHFGVASPRSPQPYLERMTEGYQPSNSAFNVVTNGDYRLCVPGYLELKQEQSQDQNDELSIDPKPTNNLLNSYSQLWNNGNSTQTHGRFSTNPAFMSSSLQHQAWNNYKAGRSATTNELIIESCRTTVANHGAPPSTNNCSVDSIRIAIPALGERQLLKENIENDGQINQNLIMDDYSSLTVSSISSSWSAGHSYECMAADFADVYPGVSYTANEHELLGIRIMEDHLDGLKSYQLPYTEGAGDGIGNQLGCSRISNQEASVKPITAIFSGGTGGLEIHEHNGVAGKVTVWAQEDMYNISNATASEISM